MPALNDLNDSFGRSGYFAGGAGAAPGAGAGDAAAAGAGVALPGVAGAGLAAAAAWGWAPGLIQQGWTRLFSVSATLGSI